VQLHQGLAPANAVRERRDPVAHQMKQLEAGQPTNPERQVLQLVEGQVELCKTLQGRHCLKHLQKAGVTGVKFLN